MLLTAIGMGWPWREKKKLCMGDALDREVFQQFVEIKQHQSVILQTLTTKGRTVLQCCLRTTSSFHVIHESRSSLPLLDLV